MFEKVPDRLIFTSVPDRGLPILFKVWHEIKSSIPSASLVITSDYLLWNAPNPKQHSACEYVGGVCQMCSLLASVPRDQYLNELMKAQILAYPCTYDELFCISVTEAQAAGAYPITSTYGALPYTSKGTLVTGTPDTLDFQRAFISANNHITFTRSDVTGRAKSR